MIGLSPCWPPSPALKVMPGTARSASSIEVARFSWMTCCGTTLMVCGVSLSGVCSRFIDCCVAW
jgi:hypothetical protein